MRFMILATIAACGLTFSAAPAWAAKGAKKNAKGEHVVSGVVVSVGNGSFVLHVHHHKAGQGKNPADGAQAGKGVAQAGKGAAQAGKGAGRGRKGHTINVTQNTQFEAGAGAKGQPATFAALKAGEHVTVHLKGKTADKVVIHTRAKAGKGFKGAKGRKKAA